MADNSPLLITESYQSLLETRIEGRLVDTAVGFDPAHSTPTNVPNYAIRWNSESKKPEIWSGTAWGDWVDEYAINVTGYAVKFKTARNLSISGGATAAGVAFDGSADVALNVTSLDRSKLAGPGVPIQLNGSEDLNTLTGHNLFYAQPSNAGATLAKNYPSTNAGMLQVLAQGSNEIEQIYTEYSGGGGAVWVRGAYDYGSGLVWIAWRRLAALPSGWSTGGDANKLVIYAGGTAVMSISSGGNLVVLGDVTMSGAP